MYEHLFSPIKIGNMELKNRIAMAPMATNFGTTKGEPTETTIAYLVERAKGGAGLIIPESNYIDLEGRTSPIRNGIYSDDVIPIHQRITDGVHKYGAKICCQLHHGGGGSSVAAVSAFPMGPSSVIYPKMGEYKIGSIPRPMTKDDINRVLECYVSGARRAVKAGYDAIQIHAGHGYLLNQFISPHFNKRTDEYGGSEENRMRFLLEVIAAVREEIGADMPIMVRLSATEEIEGGYGLDYTARISKKLEEAGVNEINYTNGNFDQFEKIVPVQMLGDGCYTQFAAEMKKVVNIPVSTVGRIATPQMADDLISQGKADLIFLGRELIADPYWPAKAQAGEPIRHCIYCNLGCNDRSSTGRPIRCTVNYEVGRESEMPAVREKEIEKKNVLVVGGGVGGMEAARVAALRGGKVTLLEKTDKLGGLANIAAIPPHKGSITRFTDWLKGQMDNENINVVLNTEYTAEALDEYKPDEVIVSTGAKSTTPPIPGIQGKNVYGATDVLVMDELPGKTAVVIGAGEVGMETVEYLLDKGIKTTVVEMTDTVMVTASPASKSLALQSIMPKGPTVWLNSKVTEIREDGVCVERMGFDMFAPADFVVVAIGRKPDPVEIEADIPVQVIGDAKKSANIFESMQQGAEAGWSL